MVVQDAAGRFFEVREPADASLNHAWLGVEVKRGKDGFEPKKNAREILIRKFGCKQAA